MAFSQSRTKMAAAARGKYQIDQGSQKRRAKFRRAKVTIVKPRNLGEVMQWAKHSPGQQKDLEWRDYRGPTSHHEPNCRAHYPGGPNRCVSVLPCPRGPPRLTGGSASTTSLSRPTQASLALRPARLLARPKAEELPD